jgi:spore coat polysaccharide biosynthesis protein SpsF (cytidylyltransferase family)
MIEFEAKNGVVIGEIACGHEGYIERLKQLIDVVSESGAQIVKFQIYRIEERALPNTKEWDLFSEWVLSDLEWEEGVRYARDKNLTIFADVYGQGSLSLSDKLEVDGYKIHSEDVLNSYFILDVISRNKVTLISVGGAKRIEIYNLLEFLKKNDSLNNIILMTGVQTFPTPIGGHSIEEVGDLIDKYSHYGVKVGFSDHISGEMEESHIIPFMAWSRGACLVEKHLTINREYQWIDYHSSLDRENFIKFMSRVKDFCSLLNPVGKMTEYEYGYRKMFKKSPTFTTDLLRDHDVKHTDIIFSKDSKNPIPISSINLVNRKINRNVNEGELCRLNTIKNNVGAIIVARCSSSRMPNKALRKFGEKESISILIDRIKKCNNIDSIILATSTHKSDDKLVDIAKRENINYFRGSLENVALRYYGAAKEYRLDHFVRITGDAIYSDYSMIDKLVESHLLNCCDVTFMMDMPFGTHNQVVSVNTIKTIIEKASVPENTEYLEYYLENDRYFNVNYVESGYSFDSRTRITLDYEEDYEFLNSIYKNFDSTVHLNDILKFLTENPSLIEVNTHKMQKTPFNQNLNVSLEI